MFCVWPLQALKTKNKKKNKKKREGKGREGKIQTRTQSTKSSLTWRNRRHHLLWGVCCSVESGILAVLLYPVPPVPRLSLMILMAETLALLCSGLLRHFDQHASDGTYRVMIWLMAFLSSIFLYTHHWRLVGEIVKKIDLRDSLRFFRRLTVSSRLVPSNPWGVWEENFEARCPAPRGAFVRHSTSRSVIGRLAACGNENVKIFEFDILQVMCLPIWSACHHFAFPYSAQILKYFLFPVANINHVVRGSH